MILCLLANAVSYDTGNGIDRYSIELYKRIRRFHQTTFIEQGRLRTPWGRLAREAVCQLRTFSSKANLYHALSQLNSRFAVVAGKGPLVTTLHDLIPYPDSLTSFYQKDVDDARSRLSFAYMRWSTWFVRKSDLFIVPFEITKTDLSRTLGIPKGKIKVIPYGVDTDTFRPQEGIHETRSRSTPEHVPRRILFVGGLSRAKGADVLMRAFSLVQKEFKDSELLVMGDWHFFNESKLVRELGIEERVRFLGHVGEDRLPQCYNSADLIVLPSKIGFSLPILEGMACGKVVITSDTPDIKEIVADSALLVSPTNPNQLAETIMRALGNEEFRARISQKALSRSRLFTWDAMALKTLAAYEEVLGN